MGWRLYIYGVDCDVVRWSSHCSMNEVCGIDA